MDMDQLGPSSWLFECHQGYGLAHLLPGDKGWEDVHLLLLTAEHLDGQPYIGN